VWKTKKDEPRFADYANAIQAGLDKIGKYYNRLDAKPAIIAALGEWLFFISLKTCTNVPPPVLHPYFKLHWITLHWGGAEEQK
jgi:hypothetical protein